MLFNTINYFLFLSSVLVVYYILPDKLRWILLFIASILFYAIGGVATIFVPAIIALSTFICGILMVRASNLKGKKLYFIVGLFINLGLLVFFKYINFFISTVIDGLNLFNHFFQEEQSDYHSSIVLKLLAPLGISYVTFQAIGYLIEIKRGIQNPEKNIGLFTTYLIFFPKLLSGPIERAHNFIPQLREKHEFDPGQIVKGLKRILWGLFLKLVVANRLSIYTDTVFSNSNQHSGITLFFASIFFAIQLFADFAGYTNMAIGSAQLFGYRLMENFDNPFIAKSVTEFWRRWHISLTTWVTEYIFNPIVINCRSWNKCAIVFASMITFLILGFWHGASWNFILFGFLQGFILAIEFLSRKLRKRIRSKVPSLINNFAGICFTFGYFCFSIIFFKSINSAEAFTIIEKILSFKGPFFIGDPSMMIFSVLSIFLVLFVEFKKEFSINTFTFFNNKSWVVRNLSYSLLIILILLIGVFDGGQFIYFQF